MEQYEHIQIYLKNSNILKQKDVQIQKNYESYLNSGNEQDFAELIKQLNIRYKNMIEKYLKNTGCYYGDYLFDIQQEAKIAIWEYLEESRRKKEYKDRFGGYACIIYKHKTFDYIRKILNERKGLGKPESMNDDTNQEEKGKKSDQIASENKLVEPEAITEQNEKRQLFQELLEVYCKARTTSQAERPCELALYY